MSKSRLSRTETSGMTLKPRRELPPMENAAERPMKKPTEPPTDPPLSTLKPSRDLMKNLSMSAALVLCVVALRAGAIPGIQDGVDAVLTAASGDTLLDDQLGKLSFVSSIFPEATLVFGESTEGVLAMPVMSGSICHAWSREEPYLAWATDEKDVFAAMDGEVSGVFHGNGDEVLVTVSGAGGLSCVYGNLEAASVSTGDVIAAGERIGTLLPGAEMAFEVRQDGISVDPVTLLPSVQ